MLLLPVPRLWNPGAAQDPWLQRDWVEQSQDSALLKSDGLLSALSPWVKNHGLWGANPVNDQWWTLRMVDLAFYSFSLCEVCVGRQWTGSRDAVPRGDAAEALTPSESLWSLPMTPEQPAHRNTGSNGSERGRFPAGTFILGAWSWDHPRALQKTSRKDSRDASQACFV